MGDFRIALCAEVEKFSASGSVMAHQRAATTNAALAGNGSRAKEEGLVGKQDRAGRVGSDVAWTARIAGMQELPWGRV